MKRMYKGIVTAIVFVLSVGPITAQDYKITTTTGQVEWVILEGWNENDGRHRLSIDMREFPSDGSI